MKPGFVPLALVLLLTGCQPAYRNGEPNLSSPYYRPPAGSTLELLEPLTAAARSDRIYFQDGRSVRWHDVNQYGAYCALMLDEDDDRARTIEPATYTIRAVSDRYLFRLARAPEPGLLRVAVRDDDGGEDYKVLALIMKLEGPDPRIEALACADWGIPQGARRVTVRMIRAALGGAFALRLAEN